MSPQQEDHKAPSLGSLPPYRKHEDAIRRAKLQLSLQPSSSGQRGCLRTLLLQTGCLLWLLPITALLTLNFKRHIVGASAWCPDRDCHVGWFNPIRSVPMENLREFDKRDHTLLGWLQLAAKALEIWFGLVAAALVYLLTFMIAGKSDGLPIGYLMRPSEFADVPGLCDPSLWKTMSPVFNARDLAGRRTYRLKIVLYVVFTVTLCILCNLMGPATAVLAIPSLQWIKTPPVGNRVFDTLNSASAPTLAILGIFNDTNCTEADMRNLSFSCAAYPFATQLDSWTESYLASDRYVNGDAQELGVKFHLNQTFRASNSNVLTQDYSDVTWWTPCRQVLMSLELDRGLTVATSFGSYNDTLQDELESYDPGTSDTPETYEVYNRSIQMIIQRNGPSLAP